MIEQYFGGKVPAPQGYGELESEIITLAEGLNGKIYAQAQNGDMPAAAEEVLHR